MVKGLELGVRLIGCCALGACSGGGGDGAQVVAGGDFVVLETVPTNNGRIFLNDPVNIDLSKDVDLDSASLTTVSFQALDQLGAPVSELVSGNFCVVTSPGDTEPGRRLQFVPRFAANNTYDDGGFRAGRTYLVQLVGGQAQSGTALRDATGRALSQPVTFSFTTAEGTTPAQLFRNPKTGGPTRTGLEVTTATDLQSVPLNLLGSPPVEVRLSFDQALNPNDGNVPVSLDSNPLVRDIDQRGRVYLEYDDPTLGADTWIPADVELERNDLTGAELVLRPVGVLPNNAEIRIIVENTLEDISGESNVSDLAYDRVFGSFRTASSYEQQFNGIVEDFTDRADIDLDVPFPEPIAEVRDGYLKAGFAFEGRSTTLDYAPNSREVVLDTQFTQIVPTNGLPFNVNGGVFNFHDVTIPQGVTVQGRGPNPMIWLVSGDFRVAGELSVRGGDGARVNGLITGNFVTAGGVGSCGGGNGGDASPDAVNRDLRGANGNGPLQVPGRGGGGGRLACTAGCYGGNGGGSGGGGGSLASQGDPHYRQPQGTGTSFQQKVGIGGAGCSGSSIARTGVLAGGEAGARPFVDNRNDNDFWGSGLDYGRNIRITGELSVPMGGGGGGGGGDTSPSFSCSLTANQPANDFSGGGGGGGGGVLIVKALGEIEVLPTGRINADGGNGGGGAAAGSCGDGGGGGGGSGGMVVLMSAKRIILHAHGVQSANRWRYAQNDYDFVLSADGGTCRTGTFGAPVVTKKYPASGSPMMAGAQYDENPLGGLGGMGLVQLMTPPGDNSTDGTNTRLDDNIVVIQNGLPLSGTAKQQMLAWRGFPNASGTYVDDNGTPTNIGDDEGDIRPTPTLLPVPFNAKSRVRSKWIDTGFSKRRALAAEDGLPRGLVTTGGAEVGPVFEFAGTNNQTTVQGYVDYEEVGNNAVKIKYPAIGSPMTISTFDTSATYLGEPAIRVELAAPIAGDDNRYRQYEAELMTVSNSVLSSGRILAHSGNEMFVSIDAAAALLETPARLQVRAKFFKIVTSDAEGLGPVYSAVGSNTPIPNANVRIGFAFHQDPQSTVATMRYPTNPQDFVYDMQDSGLQAWITTHGAPQFVQWDVTFDTTFSVNGSVAPNLSPATPLPELHFLRLPWRF
ncbi:MAG: hypothetical protein H6838_15060 [Planctomycetes bacterium]|nr:hypothetical protein [Planctomycetota bacterium]